MKNYSFLSPSSSSLSSSQPYDTDICFPSTPRLSHPTALFISPIRTSLSSFCNIFLDSYPILRHILIWHSALNATINIEYVESRNHMIHLVTRYSSFSYPSVTFTAYSFILLAIRVATPPMIFNPLEIDFETKVVPNFYFICSCHGSFLNCYKMVGLIVFNSCPILACFPLKPFRMLSNIDSCSCCLLHS